MRRHRSGFFICSAAAAVLLTVSFAGCRDAANRKAEGQARQDGWNDEIIYHVMPRSFYDSNGDGHGDLNGFVEKLDYLQELGVTAILFTPLFESGFYHNYFPVDYTAIDPEYGTMEDYLDFVRAVHGRGMKFIMDMETQYVQSGHPWFDDSYRNPSSEYSDFICYSDSLNEYPEQIFMPSRSPLTPFTAWPGDRYYIVYLDLNNPRVKEWMSDFYASWVDPDGDGHFKDGVDGFRIDHIMDDLDYKGLFTNMYEDFWNPIFRRCKSMNPDLFIVGEQSDWNGYGEQMVSRSGADAAFNFPLLFAFRGEEGTRDMYAVPDSGGIHMDPDRIHEAVLGSLERFSGKACFINFLENHDTERWASRVQGNGGQMRTAAVMLLLMPGIPSIYYGQELGMTGTVHEWGSDANHLPVREAFPWSADPASAGTAVFYKGTGEWWDSSIYNTGAVRQLALTVQRQDPGSLWNFYRELIALRKEHAAFRQGSYEAVDPGSSEMIAFKRVYGKEAFLVIVNLSGEPQNITALSLSGWQRIAGGTDIRQDSIPRLGPYGFVVLRSLTG